MGVLVRNAWHAVGMARTAEALFVAAGLGLVTAAAGVAAGLPLRDPVTWGLSVAAGVAMGVSWFVDLRPRADVLARRIDRTLRLDGALVTAWELESRGVDTPLAALLARRVRLGVPPKTAVRAALPASLPFLAVPFLAAMLLARVCRVHADDGLVRIQPALGATVGALEDAERVAQEELAAGAMSAADLRELAGLTRRARELAAAGDRAGDDPAAAGAFRRDLEALAAEIEELGQERATRAELSRALDHAAACADAARQGLEGAAGEERAPDEASGAPAGAKAGGDSGASTASTSPGAVAAVDGTSSPGPPDAGAGGAGGELADGDLAISGADGTIPAHSNAGDASPDPDPAVAAAPRGAADPAAATPAGSVALDRWWPARHATLAGRWVESRRARVEDAATTSNQDND